jgi:hypothetical protein
MDAAQQRLAKQGFIQELEKSALGAWDEHCDHETTFEMMQVPEVYRQAWKTFAALQATLKGNAYLLGTLQPTSVDCVAYGFLALHLYPSDLPQPFLRNTLIRKYPTLVTFCDRMKAVTGKAGVPTAVESASVSWAFLRKEWWEQKKREDKREEQVSAVERRNRLLAIVGGVGVFVGFVWWNGIVQVDLSEADEH